MSWFGTLKSNVKSFLNLANPNKVLDAVAENYVNYAVHSREDSLVLYEPSLYSEQYELVLHRPCSETLHQAYSLCRCNDLETAEWKFLLYKDKIPKIVSSCRELNSSAQIQKMCDTITEHPSWNIAHLATQLGVVDCLDDPQVAKYINEEETQLGISPLQLAIQFQNIKMVQALLNHNASLDHFDNEHNSVLHYGASTNKQIVNILCEKSKNTLNSRNASGRTPLHVACYSDKRDCVHALLEAGADVNISVTERRSSLVIPGCVGSIENFPKVLYGDDIKYGGTPLHWACSREVIELLVNKNCDINSLNFDQRTALHVMVLRKRLDCLVALLCYKADCNIADKDGNTPLHLAAMENNEDCLKALLVFGADMSLLNINGHLPRHGISCDTLSGKRTLYILHSVGAPRCSEDVQFCNIGCKFNESYNGEPVAEPLSPAPRDLLNSILDSLSFGKLEKKGCLLCLDGGGIRGLVLILILMELEKHFDRPIVEYFDWIAGTSAGGLVTLSLALGKPLSEMFSIYFKFKDVVWGGRRPYSSDVYENILKETFGENVKMSDITKPKVMLVVTLADRLPIEFELFRNYSSPSNVLGIPHQGPLEKGPEPDECYLWKAARATTAAPVYFKSFDKYMDGGLIGNNPTLDALTEIHEYNTALIATNRIEEVQPVSLVVSIGTGIAPVVPFNNEVEVSLSNTIWAGCSKVFNQISKIGMIVIHQATQSDGRVVDRARSWCSSMGISFYRFSPQLSEDVSMDEKDNKVIVNMLWETKAYMHSRQRDVLDLVKKLKNDP